MSYFTQVAYSDTGSLDAFSRLRISQPETLFATQTQYNTDPLQMEAGTSGSGATAPTWNSSTRMTALTVATGTGASFLQSYQYSPYQPGKSHFVALTGVLGTGVATTTVDVGYFDANNGVIFRQNGATNLQLILRTSTSGSASDANIVAQSAWNIDRLDGSNVVNPSGITLDVTKAFILIIDLQFLGMGRVRVGFDINGVVYYAHQFTNANYLTVPYMQTATLPVQMMVTSTSLTGTKTAYFKCATVQSEGGNTEKYGFPFCTPENTATAGNATRVPLISIRPKTTFNGVANRTQFLPRALNIYNTGNQDVLWEIVLGGAYSGQSWSDVNTTYSAYEYSSTPGAYTNLTGGGIILSSGYATRVANAGPLVDIDLTKILYGRPPITLDRSGAVRALGTMTVLVTGFAATSTMRGSIEYIEVQ